MYKNILITICLIITAQFAFAQLPAIKVLSVRGRSIVSFQNQYANLMSITLERSNDSSKNYLPVTTVNNPKKGENAIADENPYTGKNFYRLHIIFGKDMEWYSNRLGVINNGLASGGNMGKNDTVIAVTKNYTDNGNNNGNVNTTPENTVPIFEYIPSTRVFSNSYTGHINIKIPDAKSKRYSLTFFNGAKKQVLHIDRISNPDVILEKRNINYKGYMSFSLQESGVEVEKGFVLVN